MKGFSTLNIYSQPNFQPVKPPQLFFGSGKVKLFSDFDGTYLPAEHKTLSLAKDKSELGQLEGYFTQVGKFLAQNKSGFQFTVTTGRNLCEFQSILNHCKRLGLKMPLPDSLIIKNGADEYIKSVSEDEFYRTGSNPFQGANESKRQALKDTMGWDGPLIREKLIETLKQNGFKDIRQDGTTNSAGDYGAYSTLHHVHDRFHEDSSHISPWTTVIRQDGNLKFFIGLPKDMQARGDRRHAQSKIQAKIEKDLRAICKESNGHPGFSIKYQAKDGEYGNHPSITIVPKINGHDLTKVYDTHKAVTDAKLNNDLVITAGDGSNDFEMLNPARYVTLPPELEQTNHQTHFVDNPAEFLKVLASNPTLKNKFEKLPFLGIVVERNGRIPQDLKSLVDAYASGPNPKIIKVQEGHVFEGVLKAIQAHQSQNHQFAELMDTKLKSSIPAFQKDGFYAGKKAEEFQNTLPVKDSLFTSIKKKFLTFFNWLKSLFVKKSKTQAQTT